MENGKLSPIAHFSISMAKFSQNNESYVFVSVHVVEMLDLLLFFVWKENFSTYIHMYSSFQKIVDEVASRRKAARFWRA